MDELNNISITKISLTISILGIIFLLILSNTLEPRLIKIKDINSNEIYKKIKIKGQITNTKTYDNFKILELKDSSGKINVIINNPNSNLNLTNNQTLTVTGKITEYSGVMQINADKIMI